MPTFSAVTRLDVVKPLVWVEVALAGFLVHASDPPGLEAHSVENSSWFYFSLLES